MNNKKLANKTLNKVEALLKETKLLPDSSLYITLYNTAHSLKSMGKYELCIEICGALIEELHK